MATQQEVIKAFMKSLDNSTTSGVTALNNAVKACSSFSSVQKIIDQLISDCKSAKSVDSFLKEKCGIILDNTDTGAIIGSDAGGSKTKTAESIVPESGKATYPSSTSFTKRGLTVVIPAKSTLTKDQQTVVQGLYSWWIDEALKLLEESYGYSFTDSDATVKKITLKFLDSSSAPAAYVTNNSTSTNGSAFKTNELTLNVNMNYFRNLSSSNVNGKSSETSSYLDRVLAHELTHAIMAAKIDNAQEIPNFIMEGMAELTHGADDRASDIKKLVGNPAQLKARLNVKNNGKVSPTDLDYAAGYIFLRYLAKQGASSSSSTSTGGGKTSSGGTYTLSGTNGTITKGATYKIAKGFTGKITINTTDAVTLDGTNAGDLKEIQIVTSSSTADLTIKDLNIANDYDSVIRFGKGKLNKLNIKGNNVLLSGHYLLANTEFYNESVAGINVGGGLTINGNGSLYVKSGETGIGTDKNEKNSADIIIDGGTITAISTGRFGNYGDDNGSAAIGSGWSGSIGNITINNGTITAIAGDGAGIGAGREASAGNIKINGGTVNAASNQGAGIGNAYKTSSVGDISIGVNAAVNAKSNSAQGIGKGKFSGSNVNKCGKITFTGTGTASKNNGVVITNGDYSTQVSINGKTYIGRKLTFSNGKLSGLVDAPDKIINNGTLTYMDSGSKSITFGKNNTLISGTAGDDSITSVADKVTITALNGNDSIKVIGDKISINAGDGNDYVLHESTSVSENKLAFDRNITIYGGKGNDIVYCAGNVFGEEGNDSVYISKLDSLKTSTVHGGKDNDFIEFQGYHAEIYGDEGDDAIHIGGTGPVSYSGKIQEDDIFGYVTVDGGAGNDKINIGSGFASKDYYSSVAGGAGDDEIVLGDNRITASGGKGNDKICLSCSNAVILYTAGDGNDTIRDDMYPFAGYNNVLSISGGSYTTQKSGNDVLVKVGSGSILIEKNIVDHIGIKGTIGSGGSSTQGGGTTSTLMTVTNSTKSPVTVGAAVKTINASSRTTAVKITGNTLANSISGGSGNDTLYGGAGNDSILGNAGNDRLYGQDGNDFLSGGAGNDSLAGGAGNDTFTGGAGNDYFFHGGGKDVITDYATGDTIKISSGKISKSTLSGSDVVFTVGTGSLTVKNAKGKSLAMIDSASKTFSTVVGGSTASTLVTVTNSTKSPVTVGAAVKTINASSRTTAVKITGNTLANSISGGSGNDTLYGGAGNDLILGNAGNDRLYGQDGNDFLSGGAGNDSIAGGAGNDSLWGDAGKDTFFYADGAGKDVIFGFETGDLLQITGTFSGTYNKSAKTIAFKVGSTANAITLKDFTAISFNVNGDNYSISGTKLVKK